MSLTEIFRNKSISITEKFKLTKGIFQGEKIALFSCGNNLLEFQDKFDDINSSFYTLGYKSAAKFLDYKCDIFCCDTRTNHTELDKVNDASFKIYLLEEEGFETRQEDFLKLKYDLTIANHNNSQPTFLWEDNKEYNLLDEIFDNLTIGGLDIENVILTNRICCSPIFKVFPFLKHLGFKQIYLLGFYYCDDPHWGDRNNLMTQGHYFDGKQMKEAIMLRDQIQTTLLKRWCDLEEIEIFNVSSAGCASYTIPRVKFNDDMSLQKLPARWVNKDVIELFNDKIDYKFFSSCYMNSIGSKWDVIRHYFGCGFNLNYKLNDKCSNVEIKVIDFDIDLLKYFFVMYQYKNLPLWTSQNSNRLLEVYVIHFYHLFDFIYKKHIKRLSDIDDFILCEKLLLTEEYEIRNQLEVIYGKYLLDMGINYEFIRNKYCYFFHFAIKTIRGKK